jgi:monoamine oxidase
MTTRPFEVVMLGGGNTGIAVTGWVRRAGMSVAMIDARDLGGARSHAEKDIGASWSRLLNKAGDTDRSYMRRHTEESVKETIVLRSAMSTRIRTTKICECDE